MKRLVLSGALAQRPDHGGHVWALLQWWLGLDGLGWDVLFVDRLGAGAVADPAAAVARLVGELRPFGLEDALAVLGPQGEVLYGPPRAELVDHARTSVALFDVMGHLGDEELLGAVPRRVFVDIDPGFPQLWHELGLHDAFAGHDAFVTVGTAVGLPGSTVPTCGRRWVTTLPPVVLEQWPAAPFGGGEAWTSVVTWRGPFGPIEAHGRVYGLRAHEFRKLVALPARTGRRFALALAIDPTDGADIAALGREGWELLDPVETAGTAAAYQSFLRGSRAELLVAKHLYVATRGGWFSDRSACYLASGKPVVASDTGVVGLPAGEGFLTYSSSEEAAEAVLAVEADYPRHAAAARRLAADHLDARTVLTDVLDRVGVSP